VNERREIFEVFRVSATLLAQLKLTSAVAFDGLLENLCC